MQQLRTRLSQMGRQVSVVRNVEHVCGRGGTERSGEQASRIGHRNRQSQTRNLHEIVADDEPRIDLHDAELNRVLGGGLVQGSLVLIGGEPGIGKSTLVLQTVLRIPEKRILYVSGEESTRQLKLRADRLTSTSSDCLIVCETSWNRFTSTSKIFARI